METADLRVTVGTGEGPAWLGLDLGTQGCRAVAVDEMGNQLTSARVALSGTRRAGRHEQDPAAWIAAVHDVLAQVSAALDGRSTGGVAICGTSGTIVMADGELNPLTSGLMYDDARGAERVAELAEIWSDCAARNGYRIQPTWALAKLASLLRDRPELRGSHMFHVADYIGSVLAGRPVATDWSHALKSGYDLVAERWPEAELERAGIPVSLLPPVVRPGVVVGTVGGAASSATGISCGTPIVAGMTDGCASQIAAGTVRPGQWNCALGTTLVFKGVADRLIVDPDGAVYSHRHPDGGWLPGGASSSGAGALATAFPDTEPAKLDQMAAPLLPTDLVSYPISVPGERFPFVRPDAEPFRSSTPASEGELAASLIQGVAFVERLCLSHLADLGADTSGALSFTGGATNSELWNQTRVDVLGREARLPRYPEAAFGMAVVAASHGGSVADTAERLVTQYRTVTPRDGATARWHEPYLAMVDQLERRGYIRSSLARAARAA